MSTSAQCMEAAYDHGFQRRVKFFMQIAASAVLGEDNGGVGEPTVAEHALRVAYAKSVLAGTASVFEYTVAVVSNATIAGVITTTGHTTVTYNDLEFTVNSLFSDFSGYDTD